METRGRVWNGASAGSLTAATATKGRGEPPFLSIENVAQKAIEPIENVAQKAIEPIKNVISHLKPTIKTSNLRSAHT
jgi:hypothetical protein